MSLKAKRVGSDYFIESDSRVWRVRWLHDGPASCYVVCEMHDAGPRGIPFTTFVGRGFRTLKEAKAAIRKEIS